MLAQRHAFLFEPSQYPINKNTHNTCLSNIFWEMPINLLAKADYQTISDIYF